MTILHIQCGKFRKMNAHAGMGLVRECERDACANFLLHNSIISHLIILNDSDCTSCICFQLKMHTLPMQFPYSVFKILNDGNAALKLLMYLTQFFFSEVSHTFPEVERASVFSIDFFLACIEKNSFSDNLWLMWLWLFFHLREDFGVYIFSARAT